MEPSNDHELAIKVVVDTLATKGRLSIVSSIPEVAASLQFMMTRSDSEFLVHYMRWRSRTAILGNPPHQSHVVYSYTDDRHLVDTVGFYTTSGLDRHGAVILIATESHRSAIKRYLKSDGNVEVLEASGQLSFLDAAEVMSTFMVDGNPDPKLFKAGIRTLIEQASRDERTGRHREVRIFGEMVSLLWPINTRAAERLEELGNEVLAEYSVQILCAYSLNGPGRSQLPESLINAHSHSIAQ
jgi:hypothetical protein